MQTGRIFSLINLVLYLLLFTSVICSWRAVSSMSIAAILITGITRNKIELKVFFYRRVKNLFLGGCLTLFLIHLIALCYTTNITEGIKDIRLSSGLLFIPLSVCCTDYITRETRRQLLASFCIILATLSLYCLSTAVIRYSESGDPSWLFYHALVSPLQQHAVYYSILVFTGLLFLLEGLLKNNVVFKKYIHVCLIVFLSIFLFLLSSKLVLVLYIVYLVFYFTRILREKLSSRSLIISLLILFILAGVLTLFTTNPISRRFYDITKGDITVINQEKFSPAMYFNGLQFRLLQWKFTAEILDENHAWPAGVSPGDAQDFLNQEYITTKMYVGDPVRGDTGFLGYNTHNQLLETLLQTGIMGLIVLLIICLAMVRMAWTKKDVTLSWMVILFLAWLFTESVLETQYGLLIFTFFPLFFYQD